MRKREAVICEKEEKIETQEKSLLTFLDLKFEPNKAKNFYSKTVKNLKVKLNEYIRLFEEYRGKYNKLTVKYTNLEQINTENKIENTRLKNENRKLMVALQIYKKSDSIVSNDIEYTP
ncbi:hypothetical protein [Vibrio vulnificus]|uniref:hypothetical protein n=1 Tax=Vibrio vulnificus TaxID=672 RepID=UPI001F5B80CC|nr:hypothetical protein [Vibrio vulnificus]